MGNLSINVKMSRSGKGVDEGIGMQVGLIVKRDGRQSFARAVGRVRVV